MANQSVNDSNFFTNLKDINEPLLKAEALLELIMNCDLTQQSFSVVYQVLWVIQDLVVAARQISDPPIIITSL